MAKSSRPRVISLYRNLAIAGKCNLKLLRTGKARELYHAIIAYLAHQMRGRHLEAATHDRENGQ